jgi:hypothetical protein
MIPVTPAASPMNVPRNAEPRTPPAVFAAAAPPSVAAAAVDGERAVIAAMTPAVNAAFGAVAAFSKQVRSYACTPTPAP